MDRGYDGLKVFEHCNRIENLSYLIRIRSGMTKEIKALPDKELDLDLKFEVSERSKRLPYRMKIQAWDMELPATVSFRLLKVKLKTLYEKRWKIELAFRDIKHALGALHFHSKKDLFNVQEFFAHLVRYNLTGRIIRQVHLTKTKKLKYRYEINFKNVAQVIQNHCRRTPDYKKILEQIKHYVHPLRGNCLFQRHCRYFCPVSFNYRVA